ncbi:hypothetical protein XENTR_v10009864, partial [Xenopus tropicalis]
RMVAFDFDADDYENMETDIVPVPKRGKRDTAAEVPTVTFDGDADDYENMENDVPPPVPNRAKKGKKDQKAKAGDSSPQSARTSIGAAVCARLKSRWWLVLLLLIILFFLFLVLAILTGLLFIQYSSISDELRNLKNLDAQKTLTQNEMKTEIKYLQGKLEFQKTLEMEQNKIKQEMKNMQEELGVCDTCPSDWIQIGASCYYLSTQTATWEKALNACIGLKGLLLILKDEKEMESVNKLFSKNTRYWIGLKRDPESSNKWRWLDGTQMTFSNWFTNEPNNSGNQENCVENMSGRWNDLYCEESLRYICKMSLNYRDSHSI